MTFSTVLTVILILYGIYYVGMFIHDAFFDNKGVIKEETIEESEIDISDEAKEFSPIPIYKDEDYISSFEKHQNYNQEKKEEDEMNGAIEVNDLIRQANTLSEKGEESELGKLVMSWNLTNA